MGQGVVGGFALRLLVAAAVAYAALMIALGAQGTALALDCANEAFRVGPSSRLPDCRAYELVTPPDTDGRSPSNVIANISTDLFPMEAISPSGGSVVFEMFGHPLLSPGGGNGSLDVYESVRTPSGWETVRRMTPSGPEGVGNPGGISANHQYGFVHVGLHKEEPPNAGSLAAEGSTDYLSNPDGSFEVVGTGSLGVERLAHGRFISADGEHIVFTTGGEWCTLDVVNCPKKQLEPTAAPDGTAAVYERSADGPTKVVSLLPGDVSASAGEDAIYQGTSADGSAVAFSIVTPSSTKLYIRSDNETSEVAEAPFTFAGISRTGDKIFYVESSSDELPGNVFQFDVASGQTTQITSAGDAALVNISPDGSRVYFVSPSELAAGAAAGEPNLYVWDEAGASTVFVAIVAQGDLESRPGLTKWTSWAVTPGHGGSRGPGAEASRTTPTGSILLFESRAQLTAYPTNGHKSIYRYDAEAKTIECVSCDLTAPQSTGDARLQNLVALLPESGGAATVIHNLSDDGTRAFFETTEALSRWDVDGINDIYQWQSGPLGASVSLISSGESKPIPIPDEVEFTGNPPRPNTLLGVTPNGSDVVFVSMDRLVPQGGVGGVAAIYDARVGGGFPEPPPSPVCLDESACRGPASPPASFSRPDSEAANSGNVVQRRHNRHSCRKARHGKRRSKGKACRRHKPVKAAKK